MRWARTWYIHTTTNIESAHTQHALTYNVMSGYNDGDAAQFQGILVCRTITSPPPTHKPHECAQ